VILNPKEIDFKQKLTNWEAQCILDEFTDPRDLKRFTFSLLGPLFIFQWQYDPTQIMVDNPTSSLGAATFGQHLMSKVMMLATDMKKSLTTSRTRYVFHNV
jgi:hypothetical protein